MLTNNNATSNVEFKSFKNWVKTVMIPKGLQGKEFRTISDKWADPNDPSKGRVPTNPYNVLRFTNKNGKYMNANGDECKVVGQRNGKDLTDEVILKVAKKTQEKQGMEGTDFTWDWIRDNMNALQIAEVVSQSGLKSFVLALGAVATDIDMSDFD